jgi:anti-sigma factor RsiW
MMMSFKSRILRLFGRSVLPQPCEEARTHSSDYIDGEIDSALEQKIRAHLGDCPLCEAFFRTLRETIAVLRGMSTQAVPAGFAERVRNNIHRA